MTRWWLKCAETEIVLLGRPIEFQHLIFEFVGFLSVSSQLLALALQYLISNYLTIPLPLFSSFYASYFDQSSPYYYA